MMPARIGLATPRAATSSRRRSYSSTLKKNCVIAKSARFILKARCLRSDVRSGERGWPAGCAATPIDLKPRLRPSSTSSDAYSSSLYCSSAGSGSPPSASRFSSPAARNALMISPSSPRGWATQVRCGIGVSAVVLRRSTTTRVVRSRDMRPPRYVTETKEGLSGCRSAIVRVRSCCSSASLGGKNSNEKVCPAARRSVIRAIGGVYGEHWRRTGPWSARPVEPVDEDRLAAAPDVAAQQMHGETLGDLSRRGIFGLQPRDQARAREPPERLIACGRGGLRCVAAAPCRSGEPPSDLEVSGTHHPRRGRIQRVERHEASPLAGVADADRPPTEAVLVPAEQVALEPRGDLVSVPGHTRADEPHDLGISAQLGPSAAVVLTPASQLEPMGP